MNRNEIWWANLSSPKGSEPGYRRPVLIIQNDKINRSNINTTIAIVITSNISLAAAPGNVLLKSSNSGLHKDSVANVSQIVTLDRGSLTERVGKVPTAKLELILRGIDIILGGE